MSTYTARIYRHALPRDPVIGVAVAETSNRRPFDFLSKVLKVTRFKMFGWIHQNFGYADRKVW